MVYQWKLPLYKVSADVAGAEVEACRNEYGIITPASVVERAQPQESPLHECFEWDNDKAAIKWREQEARVLIGNIVTVFSGEAEVNAPVTVRAFVNTPGKESGGYKGIVSVLNNPADREHMLSKALDELRSFKMKYASLNELVDVFHAIDQVKTA